MREAAEKKKELEKQHGESVNELRTAQAQLGLLASNKNTEVERAQHSQNIESLQVCPFLFILPSTNHPRFSSIEISKTVEDSRAGKENGIAERETR